MSALLYEVLFALIQRYSSPGKSYIFSLKRVLRTLSRWSFEESEGESEISVAIVNLKYSLSDCLGADNLLPTSCTCEK